MSKKKPLSEEQLQECAQAHRIFLEKRNALNLSQKKIADEAGISAPAVNFYFKGVNPLNIQFAMVLSKMLDVPVSDFSPRLASEIEQIAEASNNKKEAKESNVVTADFSRKAREGEIDIPQFDVRGAMGSGQLPNDYVEIIRHVTMHKSHLDLLGITYTSAANLAIITGWGQSMAGTINHGEPVFVDRGITQFIGDGVYVFTWDNLVYIKRVQKVSKTHFRIISDNRDNDPFEVLITDVVFHAQALLAWNAKKL